MQAFDGELRALHRQIARKKQVQTQKQALSARKLELLEKTEQLGKIAQREKAQADRLEGGSLSAFFYNVIGKREEKLSEERKQACAAAVKYDAAAMELENVNSQLSRLEQEWKEIEDCERQYAQMRREKIARIKSVGGEAADNLLKMEERMAQLQEIQRQIQEACRAGREAQAISQEVVKNLNGAEGWGVWDVLGGDWITDLIKHGKLDEAQQQVQAMQWALSRFQTELADVTVYADLQVNVKGFARFADFFFDGLFADLVVMERISNSLAQVQHVLVKICNALEKLEQMEQDTVKKLEIVQKRYDSFVAETGV